MSPELAKQMRRLGFELKDGVLLGTLSVGLPVKGMRERKFAMRSVDVGDLLDAEQEADVGKPLAFNAQLMTIQLVRAGDFEGPFTIEQIRKVKPADWNLLRAAQGVLDQLGEAESPSGNPS